MCVHSVCARAPLQDGKMAIFVGVTMCSFPHGVTDGYLNSSFINPLILYIFLL